MRRSREASRKHEGLDTNVLVRYLTTDDAKQAAAAERLLEQASEAGQPLFIPVLVLCELAWVLARCYGQAKAEIIRVMEHILEAEQFRIEGDPVVRRSLDAYRGGKADFADCLIGEICHKAGCEDCVTFDRALKGAAGFTLLS
jgi:predicted nucleic-acid-binding protein